MSEPYVLKKSYTNHFGLDLKSSDLIRPDGFASGMLNAQLAKNGDVEKRKGYHCYAPETDVSGDKVGGLGLYVFNRNYPYDIGTDIVAGQRDTQILACGRYLHRLYDVKLNIQYTGSDNIFLSVFFDTTSSTYKLQIYNATLDSFLANIDLGTGFEVSPLLLSSIQSTLSAIPNIVLDDFDLMNQSNIPYAVAAFLKPVRFFDLTSSGSSGYTIQTGIWRKVQSSYTYPFNGSYSKIDSNVIENVSAVEMNNLMYFSNGYDPLMKYDGTYLYKAGVPRADDISVSISSLKAFSPYIAGYWYSFKHNYRNTDNNGIDTDGNIIIDPNDPTRSKQSVEFQYNPASFGTISFATNTSITLTAAPSPAAAPGDFIQFEDGGPSTNKKHIIAKIKSTYVSPAALIPIDVEAAYNAETGQDIYPLESAGSFTVLDGYVISTIGTTDFTLIGAASNTVGLFFIATGVGVGTGTARRISGAITPPSSGSVYFQHPINITVPTVQPYSPSTNPDGGYNTRYIMTTATPQSGVTALTVASGGDAFNTGDFLWFYDSDNYTIVRGTVVSSTATTINLGNFVDTNTGLNKTPTGADYTSFGYNASTFVSTGLFHVFWRTAGASTEDGAKVLLYYTSNIVQNVPYVTQISYPLVDAFSAEKGSSELFVEPAVFRDLPPKMKYITVHRNQLVGCGDPNNVKAVHFSDIESPEWFPAARSSLNVETYVGDEMSGIAPNNNVLVVFKERSIHTISGDLTTLAVRVDPLINDIGCSSHQTIRDVRGELYFQTDRGPYKMIGGQIPVPVADSRIEPIFDQESVTDEEKYRLKRCYAFNDRIGEKYILFIPAETQAVIGKRNNSYSRCFAIDYYRGDAAFEWSKFDISSGAIEADGEIFFQGRTTDETDTSKVRTYLFRRMNLNDAWDYQDNLDPIEWKYDSNWEALGDPSVYKRFIKIRIFSINSLLNNDLFLNLKSEINYIKNAPRADITFSFPNSGYGITSYGTSSYGSQREQAIYRRLNSERVRSMRIRFSNNLPQQNVALTGWELEISTTYKQAFKR